MNLMYCSKYSHKKGGEYFKNSDEQTESDSLEMEKGSQCDGSYLHTQSYIFPLNNFSASL